MENADSDNKNEIFGRAVTPLVLFVDTHLFELKITGIIADSGIYGGKMGTTITIPGMIGRFA